MSGQATLTSERIAQEKLHTNTGTATAGLLAEIELKAAELKNAIARLQATAGSTTSSADTVINAIKAQLA